MIPLLNSAQQLATVNFLEDEIEFVIIFEELNELNDVGMSLTVMESLHFLEHSGSSMTGNFVDDLYRVLQIGVQWGTSLNRGVGTFTKNFSSEFVEF